MGRKIKMVRGNKSDLPALDVAEIGFTVDTKETFIGSGNGNIRIADDKDVGLLNSRIDTIVATAGDGTIPPELSDIRVGENGITYGSAGESVRGQLSEIKNQIALKNGQNELKFEQVDSQLAEKAPQTEVGTLSNLLTTAKTSLVNAINELFNNKANKAQEAWIPCSFFNGASGTLSYRQNQFGELEFKGTLIGTSAGVALVYLPVKFYPATNIRLAVSSSTGIVSTITINTAGALSISSNLVGLTLHLDSLQIAY